nr:EamA family transporter [Paenacidovorax monticola]
MAYLAFAWGARRLSPTAAGVGILVEPLVAAWLAAWWLGETLGPGQWAGALLLGVAILSVPRRS